MGLAGAAGSIVTLVTYLGYLFNPVDVVLMSPLVHLFVFIDSALGGKDPKNHWNPSRINLRVRRIRIWF
jgi:hypothetical protein